MTENVDLDASIRIKNKDYNDAKIALRLYIKTKIAFGS